MLPRPDLEALGVSYRRIPVLAIGRDIYCDTRLILQKLESRFPDSPLAAKSPEQKAIEKLLERWVIDGGMLMRVGGCLPTNLPWMNDPQMVKDRKDFSGKSWAKEDMDRARPESLAEVKASFEFLETTLLADGREWILGTVRPSLADIEAVWPFHWVLRIPNALPRDIISETQYPKVFAWIDRFDKAVNAAESSAPKPTRLEGADAVKQIIGSDFAEPEGTVDGADPLRLEKGHTVEVWPTDTGFSRKDRGRLDTLNSKEIAILCPTKTGGTEVRIRAPRHGFRVVEASGTGSGSNL